ncbi:hypothetical protein L1987_66503 [Smallanthus sonchifolius]|uniref:Uncharacterized protein n=1 Tax=Smallanthus sonchifolius TaxID=185202 RepID=A0ACB9BXG2_9ASTR|nr:hypothetical protein L1987_66503 [Smallanthus sonchifolius]
MEEDGSVKLLSLSDLLHRSRPLTGASFLPAGHHTSHLTPQKDTPHSSHPQTPNNSKILKPLHHPSLLIGTLTLTTPSCSCSNSTCLQFSDHSAAVCCDVLDLDLRVIGQSIRVLAWNFLPAKPHGGYLEIIRWNLNQIDQFQKVPIPNFNAFYLNSAFPTYEDNIIPHYLLHGLLESVSPVTNVPCTATKTGTKNLNGFLAEITVCECELCSSRDRVNLIQHLTGEHNKDHIFSKSKTLYFCGPASIWYPAISRLVGGVVSISGMKKKMVFLGEGKSLMMYVSTERAIIHLPTPASKTAIRQKGLCSVYTGSVTGSYMQGMVVELDRKVLLLVTDNQLLMPHGLRIGAIVTVRNFHVEDPKFAWTKVVIFGSCYKTSIRVNVFSPIESGCYQVLQSRSLLRKFIESLQFSARLWVLLVVSSLRKKFAGVLSEMEILGSKHTEGLVQKYSISCLPLSVFRFRHGVFSEYCLHDLCGCGKEIGYNFPKLVVPISNLIGQCEDMFIKSLYGMNHQYSSNIVCGGKSHEQPIRKILKSEDMHIVLLGILRISEYSGKLQLTDSTGSIDVVIPDIPSVWSIQDIYEINDFNVVMEGFPRHLEHLELLNNEPFACGNIFNHFHLSGRKKINIYVHCCMKDAKSRNHILCPSINMEENLKELESGLFHLLLLVHKFPAQQKFPGDYAVSNNSSIYANAIILPWSLVLHNKEIDLIESSDGSSLSDRLKCSSGDKKQCDTCLHEFPCTIDFRVYNHNSMVNSGNLLNCTTSAKKVLLEFKSDSFLKFESLRIGGYYLIKHHYNGVMCTAKDSDKVFMNSKSHLWNVSFSSDEAGPTTARSIDGCSDICADIYLHLSPDHLNFLEIKLRELKQDLIQPTNTIKVKSASTPSGAFGVNLPTGNLLSVQGRVAAVHKFDQSRVFTRLSHQMFHGAHHHIVPGVTNSVCIHVLVDHNIVKICSSLSEHSYPNGFGPVKGVYLS